MTRARHGLDSLALLVLAIVLAASLARPIFYWDSWAYHLPFSALLLDIGGARGVFVLSDEMRARYEGFPLAAELIQGVLWKLTGTINATALVNSAALAAFVLVASRALNASLAVLTFGALSFPLIALHATSTYIDLFVGVCVAMQVLAAVKIDNALRQPARSRLIRWCAVYVASAALAGNSKVTALLLGSAIGVFFAAYLVVTRSGIERRKLLAALLCVAVAAALATGTALKNVREHANPVYPVAVSVAGFELKGPEREYRSYPTYTADLGVFARPVNWLLSITEVDWRIRRISPGYSLDASTGAGPPDDLPPRTGGYWAPLVIGTLALLVWLASRARRAPPAALRERRFLLALVGFVTLVGAFMPQSHELRYALHWPLLVVVVVAVLARDGLAPRAVAVLAFAYLATFAASQHVVGYSVSPAPVVPQSETIAKETRAPPLAAVRARAPVCLGPEYQPRQFAYSAVFHGGNYVVEQGWTRCGRYPPF